MSKWRLIPLRCRLQHSISQQIIKKQQQLAHALQTIKPCISESHQFLHDVITESYYCRRKFHTK